MFEEHVENTKNRIANRLQFYTIGTSVFSIAMGAVMLSPEYSTLTKTTTVVFLGGMIYLSYRVEEERIQREAETLAFNATYMDTRDFQDDCIQRLKDDLKDSHNIKIRDFGNDGMQEAKERMYEDMEPIREMISNHQTHEEKKKEAIRQVKELQESEEEKEVEKINGKTIDEIIEEAIEMQNEMFDEGKPTEEINEAMMEWEEKYFPELSGTPDPFASYVNYDDLIPIKEEQSCCHGCNEYDELEEFEKAMSDRNEVHEDTMEYMEEQLRNLDEDRIRKEKEVIDENQKQLEKENREIIEMYDEILDEIEEADFNE